MWLTGPGAKENAALVQSLVKVPVKISPLAEDRYYWVDQMLELPAVNTNNFVSLHLQKAPLRRRLLRVTAVLIGLLLIASVATAAYVQKEVSVREAQIDQQRAAASKFLEQKGDWQQRYALLAEHKEFLRAANAQKSPPVPVWWLGYVGDALPDELLLTRLQTRHLEGSWSVTLAGTLQATTNRPATLLARSVAKLTNNLATGPFAFKITRAATDERNNRNTFVVEGVIQ